MLILFNFVVRRFGMINGKSLFLTRVFVIFTFLVAAWGCEGKSKRSVPAQSIYDIHLISIGGEEVDLGDFRGKKMLFVNVASECGYTPQYAELQELHEKYRDRLVVIGLPCNQFGGQEPGSNEEIRTFCMENYGVTFLITEKIKVKGEGQHPLYAWLTNEKINGVDGTSVKWNFQKYLVDENGRFIDVFYSMTSPLSEDITMYLN